jgi:hypothetical protein
MSIRRAARIARGLRSRFVPGAHLELLEDRRLMAVGVDQVTLPGAAGLLITDVAVATDKSVWYTLAGNQGSGQSGVWRIGSNGTPVEVSDQAGLDDPATLVPGLDGTMWATSLSASGGSYITQYTGEGSISFSIPQRALAMTFGPDGNLWIAAQGAYDPVRGGTGGGSILRVNPVTAKSTAFPIPSKEPFPQDITRGRTGTSGSPRGTSSARSRPRERSPSTPSAPTHIRSSPPVTAPSGSRPRQPTVTA